MVNYLFDTYALIEIVKNNPGYLKYLEENVTTTRFNLVELLYIILAEQGKDAAKKAFEKFKNAVIDIPDEILLKAMEFRLKNKGKGLSYVDCIGYVAAMENKLKFLTGDDAFEKMENVEFVK
ncbi:MAG: PIN domain-containing protein [Candidatus Aenigmarchaeota archaeon]|nr:PIN domain-containing protein [Candidatus Aenigmarchaeota archaeon]